MVVRMRHTRSHTRNRRSHHAIAKPAITASADGVAFRHRVSPATGKYRGRQVVDVQKKVAKKVAKKGTGRASDEK